MRIRLKDFLFSIRSRVAVFSLLATLVPSAVLGWLSYDRNADVLRQKAEHEIVSGAIFAVREIDLWLKDRIYEVRVIGSSHLVTENLDRLAGAGPRSPIARGIQDYLGSVGTRFTGYAALQVLTPDGVLVAGSGASPKLSAEWLDRLRQGQAVVGEPQWNPGARAVTLPVAVPVRSPQGRPLGSVLAELDSGPVERILQRFPPVSGRMYVADAGGRRVSLGTAAGPPKMSDLLPAFARLKAVEGRPAEYENDRGEAVVGTLLAIPDGGWGVVVERERDVVYAQVYALRNTTFVLVAALIAAVGIGAYWIGLTLVHPLDRLVGAADRVASGDLETQLPIARRDELGKLTERFNEMTAQLKKNRTELAEANAALLRKNAELETLSVTDALTGLSNRRYLMDVLERAFLERARNCRVFTLLMADLDHFKRINDTYGHPAGDAVLVHAARIFREEIRSVDYAARFGGEEFTLLLLDSGLDAATVVAERIRARIAEAPVVFEEQAIAVTVSLGVAEVAGEAPDSVTALIGRADAALYAAKHGGRNRVCRDEGSVRQLAPGRSVAG